MSIQSATAMDAHQRRTLIVAHLSDGGTVTDEILELAGRILRGEPTRTLGARSLHLRTCIALRAELSYARFIDLLGTRPEQFAVVHDRTISDGWSAPERSGYAAALARSGFVRGATVVWTERELPDEMATFSIDDGIAALGATLADAHAALLDLIELDAAVGRESTTLDDAAVQLEELRVAYAAHLTRR